MYDALTGAKVVKTLKDLAAVAREAITLPVGTPAVNDEALWAFSDGLRPPGHGRQ